MPDEDKRKGAGKAKKEKPAPKEKKLSFLKALKKKLAALEEEDPNIYPLY